MSTLTLVLLNIALAYAAVIPMTTLNASFPDSTNCTGCYQSSMQLAQFNATPGQVGVGTEYNTVAYRAYIGFLVTGIILAVIFPFAADPSCFALFSSSAKSGRRLTPIKSPSRRNATSRKQTFAW